MPLYEYRCLKRGHRFELIRKFSDPPVTACIKCGGEVEKLISAPAIAFKGSGWYVTDYGKGGGGDKGKPDSKSETGSDTKSETPAPTTESPKEKAPQGADRKKGKKKA